MSFALTIEQVRRREKTVTRRLGWRGLKPGTRILACTKCMGLRKGEHAEVLGVIEVVDVRTEPVSAITDEDVAREGFPGRSAAWFVSMFGEHMASGPDTPVQRIEFRYVEGER